MDAIECSCSCGHSRLTITAPPRFRMLCHCTICQRFNEAPFADILIYRKRDVQLDTPESVEFDTYRPPPNVRRGKCTSCGAAAIETFHAPLLPKLTMVPHAMHSDGAELPEPTAHFFYQTRVADAEDALPRHGGFLPSQLAFFKFYLFRKDSSRQGAA